jgi:uncharacterized protein (TIGR01732 family)
VRAVLFSNDDRCLNVFNFIAYTELRTEEELAGGVFYMGGEVFAGGFALVVVLFILLIIIGASWIC